MISSSNLIHGMDISKMLHSKGPVVKCVLLKAMAEDNCSKAEQSSLERTEESEEKQQGREVERGERHVLTEAIEEIEIDTSPQRQMVTKVFGGKFTFVGQYEEEGIILMARNIEELEDDQLPPINPHVLQPPFDKDEIRGDILIMKVVETEETLDDHTTEATEIVIPTCDEFFLDYTKDEYVAFARRTDVVAPENSHDDESENDESSEDQEVEDDDTEEDDNAGEDCDEEDPDDEDDDNTGMMNILLRSILRKFTEENGRGPNTEELILLRKALASSLGVELESVPSPNEPVKKRHVDSGCSPPVKRVKFGDDVGPLEKSEAVGEKGEDSDNDILLSSNKSD